MFQKIIKKLVNRETITYIIFGILTTIINWVVYRVFDSLIGNGNAVQAGDVSTFQGSLNTFLQKGIAGIIAWIVAVLFAYVTNRRFVFENRAYGASNILAECGKFIGARIVTGIIEILGVPLLIIIGLNQQIFGMDIAKLLISVIIVVLNYIFSKIFVFKDKKNV